MSTTYCCHENSISTCHCAHNLDSIHSHSHNMPSHAGHTQNDNKTDIGTSFVSGESVGTRNIDARTPSPLCGHTSHCQQLPLSKLGYIWKSNANDPRIQCPNKI